MELAHLLTGFENLIPVIVEHAPEFKNYESFCSILEFLSSVSCPGCRAKDVPEHIKECSFRSCADEKGVLFCGECNEFPCLEAPSKNPQIVEKWKVNGFRIREIGVTDYSREVREKPRYLH